MGNGSDQDLDLESRLRFSDVVAHLRAAGDSEDWWRSGFEFTGAAPMVRGWRLFGLLEQGSAAMLAGRFAEALGVLAEAQLQPTPLELPFLTRDAYVKSALVHACFGDAEVARANLMVADRVERTDSSLEELVDASAAIARASASVDDPAVALSELDRIPRPRIGEMWPFYARAIQQVCERLDRREEAVERLQLLDDARPFRPTGGGLGGSVIRTSLVLRAVELGDPVRARALLESADQDQAMTQLAWAMLKLAVGLPDQAVAHALRARERARGMRQLELRRLSILATGFLVMGDREACIGVLRRVMNLPGGLRPGEASLLAEEVSEIGAAVIDEWPLETDRPSEEEAEAVPRCGDRVHVEWEVLTAREIEVLQLLVRGSSSQLIAEELFLSVNTVKTHELSIHRKLGVSSRSAVIVEAERRGLLERRGLTERPGRDPGRPRGKVGLGEDRAPG